MDYLMSTADTLTMENAFSAIRHVGWDLLHYLVDLSSRGLCQMFVFPS
jgi:hypothetical protein